MAVATAAEKDLQSVPHLYDAIDPDALEELADSLLDNEGGSVTFTYAGYLVDIRGTGDLLLWSDE